MKLPIALLVLGTLTLAGCDRVIHEAAKPTRTPVPMFENEQPQDNQTNALSRSSTCAITAEARS